MDRLPETLDLRKLHLEPAEITRVQTIHSKHGARLYRIECGDRSFVLKYFGDAARAAEVRCYALLEQCAVPTLPVHGRTEQALLLEDLDRSPTWRLASAEDMQSGPTGAAIARW